ATRGRSPCDEAEAARAKGTGRKTDRADTERLVVGLAQGTLPAVWVPPVQVRHLCDLLSAREGALKHQRALGNRIRALFRRAMMPIPVGCDVHGSSPVVSVNRVAGLIR